MFGAFSTAVSAGPSAGLMLATAIYTRMNPGVAKRIVAGTGDGNVATSVEMTKK